MRCRLWEDSHGVLHCVTHGGGWGQPFGFAYFSTDGGEARPAVVFHNCLLCAKISDRLVCCWQTWGGSANKAYENIVELVGGGQKILSRRERPHVVLGPDRTPIALTNGVTEAWPCTLQKEPDRPPCTKPTPPGTNPTCGPGSNGTSIWCPVDYCYTLYQALQS